MTTRKWCHCWWLRNVSKQWCSIASISIHGKLLFIKKKKRIKKHAALQQINKYPYPIRNNPSVWTLPVSKWELKAKLGLKNAEDMTITWRAKTILLVALQKTSLNGKKGQKWIPESGAIVIQVTCSRSSDALHFIPSHLTECKSCFTFSSSRFGDRCWQTLPFHHICWFACLTTISCRARSFFLIANPTTFSARTRSSGETQIHAIYTDFMDRKILSASNIWFYPSCLPFRINPCSPLASDYFLHAVYWQDSWFFLRCDGQWVSCVFRSQPRYRETEWHLAPMCSDLEYKYFRLRFQNKIQLKI